MCDAHALHGLKGRQRSDDEDTRYVLVSARNLPLVSERVGECLMKVKLDTLSAEDARVMKAEVWIKYLSTETASIISDSIKRSSFFKEYALVGIFSDVENYK